MAAPDLSAYLKFGLATLALWRERSRQRYGLRELAENPHLLRDIGLTQAEVLAEACPPFWSPLQRRISTAPETSTQTTTTWRNLASCFNPIHVPARSTGSPKHLRLTKAKHLSKELQNCD